MAGPLYYDRVKETTAITGTGTYTLAGAVTGFQAFSVVGDGNTCYYAITDNTDWEVGLGTYTSAGTTLARTTVLASSNGGSAVSWAAGTKTIWLDAPALTLTGLVNSASALSPAVSDGHALGTIALQWSDLFGASGFVLNLANGDWAATHTAGVLTVGTGDLRVTTAGTDTASVVTVGGTQTLTSKTMTSPVLNTPTVGTSLLPTNDDGAPLGSTTKEWSDLFLASGGVINWAAGDVTITHSSNTLAFAGASSGYTFDAVVQPSANDAAALGAAATSWSDLFLASGAVLNFANGNWAATHTSGILTVGTGDLRVTTAGTNTASVVTVGGTQTLTGKTLTGNTAVNLISGSGTLTLNTSGTVTVPNATDTLVGKATTDTLTNKTFDTAGTGNAFSINSQSITAVAPTGSTTVATTTSGSWTPALKFGGGSTSMTYGTQQGYYHRVGNIVYWWFYIVLTAKGSSTGAAAVTGLPTTAVANVSFYAGAVGYYAATTSITDMGVGVSASSTSVNIYTNPGAQATHANFNNTTAIMASGFYEV